MSNNGKTFCQTMENSYQISCFLNRPILKFNEISIATRGVTCSWAIKHSLMEVLRAYKKMSRNFIIFLSFKNQTKFIFTRIVHVKNQSVCHSDIPLNLNLSQKPIVIKPHKRIFFFLFNTPIAFKRYLNELPFQIKFSFLFVLSRNQRFLNIFFHNSSISNYEHFFTGKQIMNFKPKFFQTHSLPLVLNH